MVVHQQNINNAFISLLNCKAKKSLYADNFTDLHNEPHRLEYFLSVRGISFIDDTKAQNINAVWYSLESMGTQVTLILKDVHSISDLLQIKQLLMLKVKNLILLTDKSESFELLRPIVENVAYFPTMDEAVSFAYRNTEKGEAVLFCGGKKVNVEKVGQEFRNAVRRL